MLKEPPRVLDRPIQSLEDDMAGNTVILAPPAAPRRRGAGATRTVPRFLHLRTATGLTLTLTPLNGSHTHISHPRPPLFGPRRSFENGAAETARLKRNSY